MPSIGLYDFDIMKYGHIPINLEIAKLSAYYKKKRVLTSLVNTLCPDKFSTFIVRKDYEDGDFPAELFLTKNIQCGGHAFTGNIYKPLDLDIESSIPDTECYIKMSDIFGITK